MKENLKSAYCKAKKIIRNQGGIIRTSEAIKKGIHPRTLYKLYDKGELEKLSRGVYKLTESGNLSNPDLVIIAMRIPKAVICLLSALSFHEITNQVPHTISIALPGDYATPRLDYPPLTVHRFSEQSFNSGIEEYQIDGLNIKIYNPEKTIADCFKFRNKIGMDVVLEALKLYKIRMKADYNKLLEYGKICQVDKIMIPYLEANI